MEQCVDDAHCERDFYCATLAQDSSTMLNCSHGYAYSSCTCFPNHFLRCNLFKSCPSNETCIRNDVLFNLPLCLPNEVVDKSMFPMCSIFILPRYLFIILFALEICFIAIKLVLQENVQRKLRLVAGGAFLLESLVGIISTVLQAISVFLIFKYSITNSFTGFMVPLAVASVLLIISEIVVVTAERKNIKEKIFGLEQHTGKEQEQGEENGQKDQYVEIASSPRFSLSRRLILKCICIVLSVANIIFQLSVFFWYDWFWRAHALPEIWMGPNTPTHYKTRMIVILFILLAYLLAHIILCLGWRRKVISRIASSLCFGTLFGVISVWALLHPSHFPHFCKSSFDTNGIVAVDIANLLLSMHILFAATSAYNISAFKNSCCVTQEQAKFIETGILGTIPHFLIIRTSNMCHEEILIILMVSFGHITVLLAPILIEYVRAIWRSVYGGRGVHLEREGQQKKESKSDYQPSENTLEM